MLLTTSPTSTPIPTHLPTLSPFLNIVKKNSILQNIYVLNANTIKYFDLFLIENINSGQRYFTLYLSLTKMNIIYQSLLHFQITTLNFIPVIVYLVLHTSLPSDRTPLPNITQSKQKLVIYVFGNKTLRRCKEFEL